MKQKLLLALSLCVALAARAETETGFKALFNGKDLTGWEGNPKLWSAKDGEVIGQTTSENPISGNTFLIWTNGTTSDFELRCSYKITSQNDKHFANSGIQYRSKVLDPKNWVVGGYQADFEAGKTYSGILYEEKGRGILAKRGEKTVIKDDGDKHKVEVVGSVGKSSEEIQAGIKSDDWNDYVIIAKGNHVQHFINGMLTVDVVDENAAKAPKSGILALQLHAGGAMKVEFKNLRIKGATDSAATDDVQQMQGEWEIAATEANGKTVPPEEAEGVVVKIDHEKYTVGKNGRTDRGSLSLDGSKSPKQMDIRPATGAGAGRVIPAI